MSAYTAERIEKPAYFSISPLRRGRAQKRRVVVIGFDSEADKSRPFLFQWSIAGSDDDVILQPIPRKENAGFHAFFRFLTDNCVNNKNSYLIFGWNLQYEFTQLFHDMPPEFREQDTVNFEVEVESREDAESVVTWAVKLTQSKRFYMTFRNVKTGTIVKLIDGMAFYKTGLDGAAKMLGLGEKYAGVDRGAISRKSLRSKTFLKYARRDAYITRLVGEHIDRMHAAYDIDQTFTAPQFAAKVFRRHFLSRTIEQPGHDLEQLGLWSYHGGKNGFYLPGPRVLDNVYNYDITSAYPEAMRQLPNVEASTWHEVGHYEPEQHAIYRATLRYRRCTYRGVLEHDGHWSESGILEGICLTGYELDAMIERGEVDVLSCRGYVMRGEPGGPLMRYVDEFFAMKANTAGAERETAKLFLNSLYGKFFQKVPLGNVGDFDLATGTMIETNEGEDFDWRAGGLYHPPIASLITGYVRAKIHRLEHKYQAIMTSTDGMFAMVAPDKSDIGKHLGGLTVTRGALKIWRERLYIFRPDDACACNQDPHAATCPARPKAALHGFIGSLSELDAIPVAEGTYTYDAKHMVTLGESVTRSFKVRSADGGVESRRFEAGSFITVVREVVIGADTPTNFLFDTG